MSELTHIADHAVVNEIRQVLASVKNAPPDTSCQKCYGTGYASQMIDGYRTAVKCLHREVTDDERERIAIEVMDMPEELAQAEYDRRVR